MRTGKWMIGVGALGALLFMTPVTAQQGSGAAAAQQEGTTGTQQAATGGSGKQQETSAPIQRPVTMDVEELRDDINKYNGKKVTVAAEIKDRVDARAFMIESGGFLDDELLVVTSSKTAGLNSAQLTEDADIVVSGTVRAVPIVDIERELSWDLDPQMEAEFEGFRYFLVADRIEKQKR